MSSHILVVEDDPMTAKLLAFLLADAGYRPSAAADPDAALRLLADDPAHLALVDIGLPRGDGLALCAALRRARPDLPVIILSGRASLADKVEGFNRGADDYLAKPFEPQELVARIAAVLRRQRRAERNVQGMAIRAGDATLDVGELTFAAPGREPVILTPTEMKLLEHLMRNAGAVIGRESLAERVWGYEMAGRNNRINVYIRRLREKIEAEPARPIYLETMRGLGYRFRAGGAAAVPDGLRAPRPLDEGKESLAFAVTRVGTGSFGPDWPMHAPPVHLRANRRQRRAHGFGTERDAVAAVCAPAAVPLPAPAAAPPAPPVAIVTTTVRATRPAVRACCSNDPECSRTGVFTITSSIPSAANGAKIACHRVRVVPPATPRWPAAPPEAPRTSADPDASGGSAH